MSNRSIPASFDRASPHLKVKVAAVRTTRLVSAMGKTFSNMMRRPVRNWNVENRAQNVLKKMETSKPEPAPLHPSTKDLMQKFKQEHPDLLEAQKLKNEGLHDRLKGLVVNPDRVSEVTSALKPLPVNRSAVKSFEYGYLEPTMIPLGKFTLKQFLEMLIRHQQNPKEHSAQVLATEFDLDEEKLGYVLKHFHMYEMQFPKDKNALLEDEESGDAKAVTPGERMNLLEKNSANPLGTSGTVNRSK